MKRHIAVAAVLAGLLTACQASDSSPDVSDSPSAGGTALAVTESEFAIRLPSQALPPGTYTFVITNEGSKPHDFVISGPGVSELKSRPLQSTQQTNLTVTLQTGSYQVWCSVPGHREHGMQTTISVA